MRFLHDLFDPAAGRFLELRFLRGASGRTGAGGVRRRFLEIPVSERRVREEVERGRGVEQGYFGCAPRRSRRGTEDAVGELWCLWADLDVEPAEAMRALERFRPGASAVVSSGHGLHGYWMLSRPMEVRGRVQEARGILRGLQEELGADRTHDLCRMMRLPGTLNLKEAARPRICRVLARTGRRYEPGEFERFAAVEGTRRAPAGGWRAPGSERVSEVIERVRAEWSRGRRHRLALGLAGYLRKAGWTMREVEGLVAGICQGAGDEEPADRMRCVRDTYRREQSRVAGWGLLGGWG